MKNDISQQLNDILNMSFSTGQFLLGLKKAKVSPIHKKQSKIDYTNLLSNIKNINEKLLYKRLFNFSDINNLKYLLQFGFRPKYSTAHALINLSERIIQTLGEGSFSCGIFADLQKVFNTVDHNILLH